MLDNPTFDVRATLSPLRRALGCRRVLLWTVRGMYYGAAISAGILLIRHLIAFPEVPLAACAVIGGTVIALVLALIRWPSPLEAARTADRRFYLEDRLTTALEFRASDEPLVALQRRDVERRVSGLRLTNGARFSIDRRELVVAGLVALLVIAAALAPSRSSPRALAAHPDQQKLNKVRQVALAHLHAIRRSFNAGLTPEQRRTTATRHALAAISNLENQLKHARTQDEALREISAAQQRLQRIDSTLHPINGKTGKSLVKALHGYLTKQDKTNVLKGGQHLDKVASKLLRHLGDSVFTQSAPERQQTASAIQTTASGMQDSSVKSDLSKAASALGHNDLKTASQALKHAARRFSSSPKTQTMKGHVGSTRKKLDSVKNDVNGLHRNQRSSNRRTAAPNSPKSLLNGGREQGGSQASSPSGSAKQAHGKGARTRGPTGEDKRNLGGGHGHAGNGRADTNAVVYVPGLVSRGQHLLPVELHGASKPVPVVPYRRVIARYNRSARAALDRSPLPPPLQDYVRRYFTTLSQQ